MQNLMQVLYILSKLLNLWTISKYICILKQYVHESSYMHPFPKVVVPIYTFINREKSSQYSHSNSCQNLVKWSFRPLYKNPYSKWSHFEFPLYLCESNFVLSSPRHKEFFRFLFLVSLWRLSGISGWLQQ